MARVLPIELSHALGPWALELYSSFKDSKIEDFVMDPLWWKGLYFRNRFGIAGGLDKNADHLPLWQKLGCGFIEVGTVTPVAQSANEGKIIGRNWEQKIIWNKMGFPNAGAEEVFNNAYKWKEQLHTPLFINAGKNRNTPLKDAASDYIQVLEKFLPVADAFVINVSSPNTQGLRDLQNKNSLSELLRQVMLTARNIPVLVKLSPDLSPEDLASALEAMSQNNCAGCILTNTSLGRPKDSEFPPEGGLSGSFVANSAKRMLIETQKLLGAERSRYLIVSTGGVLSPADFVERRELGADLVQSYSGWVFHGPSLVDDIVKKSKVVQREH